MVCAGLLWVGSCSGPGLRLAMLKDIDLLKNRGQAGDLVLAKFAKICCGRRPKAVTLLEGLYLKENVGVEHAVSKLRVFMLCCFLHMSLCWVGKQRRPPLVSFVSLQHML